MVGEFRQIRDHAHHLGKDGVDQHWRLTVADNRQHLAGVGPGQPIFVQVPLGRFQLVPCGFQQDPPGRDKAGADP